MMTNTLLSKAMNTGKSPSALQCVDAMRVLLLALTAMVCIEASAASRASWLDASDSAASDELERYVGSFEAFHSAVLSSMDGCKNLGSIYQATRVGGDQVPAAVWRTLRTQTSCSVFSKVGKKFALAIATCRNFLRNRMRLSAQPCGITCGSRIDCSTI